MKDALGTTAVAAWFETQVLRVRVDPGSSGAEARLLLSYKEYCQSGGLPRLRQSTGPSPLGPPKEATALSGRNFSIQLVSCTTGNTEYCPETSLFDGDRYPVPALSDPCPGGWGIEEPRTTGLLSDFAAARKLAPSADLDSALWRPRVAVLTEGMTGHPEWRSSGQSSLVVAAWMVGHSINAGENSVLMKTAG